jgi:hypothetical protein
MAAKKRKRRKRPAEPDVESAEIRAPDPPELDANGRERPRFLLSFPAHPELERLAAAFEQGNYTLVRRGAPALAKNSEDPAVRAAALELQRRIEPDPLIKYLLLASFVLLLVLVAYAYSHRD